MSRSLAASELNNWDAISIVSSLVQCSPLSILALDHEKRILAANPAANRLLGTEHEEPIGLDLSTALGKKLAEEVERAYQTAADGSSVSFEVLASRPMRAPITVQATIFPERTDNPQIAAYLLLTPVVTANGAGSQFSPAFALPDGGMNAIFNSGASAVLFFDMAGQIIGANRALERMLAYDFETLSEMNVLDLVHEADRLLPGTSAPDPFADLITGRRDHYQSIRRYVHRDGHLVWVQVTVSAVRDNSSEIIYFISIMQDVTEIKLLEDVAVIANETSASFEGALQNIVEELALQLGFQAGHVLLVDDNTNRVVPTGIWYVSKPHTLTNFCALTATTTFSPGSGHVGGVFANRAATLDRNLQASSDSLRIAAAIDDGLRVGLFVPMIIHGDVVGVIEFYSTKDRVVDPVLLDTLTRIAPQLGWFVERERARETLEHKSEQLERSNRDLDRFASIASHDLREPLRAIGHCAQLLQERYEGELGDDADQLLNFITDGADRMESMIADLLRYSRISTRAVEYEAVDLNEIVRHVFSDLQVAIDENAATIDVTELPQVLGNATQLHQIFQNLIENALKYRAEEPPHIRVSARRQDRDWLISFQDNGIGIDPAYQGQIFDIFRRLHARDQYTGTGIGLAIVKRIVEQHNGRLWVESKAGHGSTFFLTLPIQGGEHTLNGDAADPENDLTR